VVQAGLPLKKPEGTPKIAAVVTEWRQLSHADVILPPLLKGYTLDVEPHRPKVQIVSIFMDQICPTDLSQVYAKQNGIRTCKTVEEALTLGTEQLAVDGVLLIGEHGSYGHTEMGQHMYPRKRLFAEIAAAFEKTGQVVPVFNDKHLAYTWEDVKWVYERSKSLGVPFMAGSSLVTCWRHPWLQFDGTQELEEAVAICYSSIEAYGYHGLETLQCMVERRKGGETGVKRVQLLEGQPVWDLLLERPGTRKLVDAAIATMSSEKKSKGDLEAVCKEPYVYMAEYVDGLRGFVFGLTGKADGFSFAAKVRGQAEPVACEFWLQEPGYTHFNYLVHNIQPMFLTGVPSYPIERTVITSGILEVGMLSRFQGGKPIETPDMHIAYQPSTRKLRYGGIAEAR
jgi:hypothetical protein